MNYIHLNHFSKLRKPICSVASFVMLTFFLSDCFHKQDRTIVIYGTITDENQQPVDSILVLAQGDESPVRLVSWLDILDTEQYSIPYILFGVEKIKRMSNF